MHAFIIRPFSVKKGIDFDRVERELIRPALEQLKFSGGTTDEFFEQGNIHTDMFEQLLIADLVIADISNDYLKLIAFWNGAIGDGSGGTQDMVQRAQDRGATFIHLDARKLIE